MELVEFVSDTDYTLKMVIDGMKCTDVGNYTCQVMTDTDEKYTNTNLDIQGNVDFVFGYNNVRKLCDQ